MLSTIQRISSVEPIENSNNLDVVKVLGWECVVQRGKYKAGDRCIYHQIDSFLPEEPQYEFLRHSSFRVMADGSRGFRIKTMKIRGVYSQGLVMPIPECIEKFIDEQDVTSFLNVKKWETPIAASIAGDVEGGFPSFIPKTNEVHLQNLRLRYEKMKEFNPVFICEKLNGSSITYYKYNGHFGVCSRNLELRDSENSTPWQIAHKHKIMDNLQDGFALQGELIGPGIQQNMYHLLQPEFWPFSLYDINQRRYKRFVDCIVIAGLCGLKYVPIIKVGRLPDTREELFALANGKTALNDKMCRISDREGIVVRYYDDDFLVYSFKVLSQKFLADEE